MNKKILTIALITPILLLAGNAKDKIEEPSTKLEMVTQVKGSILVKGYQQIGSTMYGKYSNSLKVDVYEFNNIKTKTKTYGLNIEVDNNEKYNSTASSFVDYEEISSLIKGLEYIEAISKNPTKLKNYEAIYKTNGGLEITNFNSSSGNLVAVQAGRYSTKSIYLELSQVKDLKSILNEAYNKIKSLK
ncbi:MAG: hypothetical protein M0Q02_07595 [Candidatus Muirbacterium halophilum]|jgi:hypothetical protein|nr:hypothetical protein [Candidatus Muirbacterium halophilum]